MHQIFADLCPFESFCKLFAAHCLEVIVCKFYFIIGIFFANNLSFGHMGKILIFFFLLLLDLQGKVTLASVAQLDAPSDWRPGGRGFNTRRGRQHSFVEIDHEIFSTVILSLPLIQEGQLSVSGERMCTILVNCLED